MEKSLHGGAWVEGYAVGGYLPYDVVGYYREYAFLGECGGVQQVSVWERRVGPRGAGWTAP